MEFKRSLERLKTDHFDLYQLHGISDVARDVDAAFAKDGVMDYLIERQKAGLAQDLQMLGDRGEGQLRQRRQVARSLCLCLASLDEQAPVGMRESP